MVKAILVLFAYLLAGDVVSQSTRAPVPGGVIGMLFLLAILGVRGGPDEPLKQAGHGLLKTMSLLFVPAGVGLMTQWAGLRANGPAIAAAIVLSTLLGMAATALTMRVLARAEHG